MTMEAPTSSLHRMQTILKRVPIVYRLLVGNTLIAVGAVAGMMLAHEYTLFSDTLLVAIFAFLGLILIFIFNYLTIRVSLSSLGDLQRTIDQVNLEKPVLPNSIILEADPDLQPLAEAINRMLNRLEHHNQELRALSERATHAQEDERKRIARNLHDETSQSLSMLAINLEKLENDLPPEAAALRPRLRHAYQLATRTLDDLRKIIYDLRPTMLDDLGLVSAVRWYARTILEESGMHVSFDLPENHLRMPEHLETELFRMAQEGVNNIARHANATQVVIRLSQAPDFVCLEMEDNGSGFDVAETANTALTEKRLGLLGIQERATLVGGQISIDSKLGQGTLLRVCVPCQKDEPA
jgi:two-component system sensor histidine kinase UhpB